MSEASESGTNEPQNNPESGSQSKPKIGDSMPIPTSPPPVAKPSSDQSEGGEQGDKPAKQGRSGQGGGRNRNRNRGGSGNGERTDTGNASGRGSNDGGGNSSGGNTAENSAAGNSAAGNSAAGNSAAGNDAAGSKGGSGEGGPKKRRRRRRGSGGGQGGNGQGRGNQDRGSQGSGGQSGGQGRGGQGRGGKGRGGQGGGGQGRGVQPVEQIVADKPVELNESQLESRRGKSRKGRPVGRYVMVVSQRDDATHIAILEGRNLIEYYVSKPSDDVFEIHGNIYLGRVQNVLPGMEAAFVDIATPKNAVLYRGDVQFDKNDFESAGGNPRIEQILKPRQTVLTQVTKNPIAHKGARLTTEVSLPGRFVVLVPNSDTYGISKRLPDNERKRLRQILDKVRPKGHGLIVRTAAENVTREEIERDVEGLFEQWQQIEKMAGSTKAPALLYREPEMSTRVIREEFNKEYRSVVIDDKAMYEDVASYVSVITPALADRVEYYDPEQEKLPVFERFHVHEQLHKALDRKVWLPSGGSLIIEHTEALTVIDVNTGKNVGSSSLEETVFRNNLEAAEGVAHQLRLRDIGGIIVIDFVDMEDKKNRDEVLRVFRKALSRDKTRTQVFEISELGLAEMTRKRIGEGLLESLSSTCPHCDGRGHVLDAGLRTQHS